jgi:hypothetical protein
MRSWPFFVPLFTVVRGEIVRRDLFEIGALTPRAEGHLQFVGVGDWKPTSTRPAWNAEPRLTEDDS